MKVFALLLLLTIGAVSCSQKDELPECMGSCTVVTGRLLTSGSAPLANAPVTLQWIGGSASTPRGRNKANAVTDKNGRYRVSSFLSDDELAGGFITVLFKPDNSKYYLIGEPQVAFYKPKRDTVYTAPDFLLPRKGFVQFIVTNPSLIPASYSYYVDLNSCYGTNMIFSSNILGGGATFSCYGLNTPYRLEVAADQPILLKQRKNKVIPDDTLFVAAGTTQTYTLTY